jgi:hypothetical protein
MGDKIMNELERVFEQVVTVFEGLRKKNPREGIVWNYTAETQKNHAELLKQR